MRAAVTGTFGPNAGCIVGIALFDHGPGIELQPIALALVCAVAATIAGARFRRGAGRHGKNGCP